VSYVLKPWIDPVPAEFNNYIAVTLSNLSRNVKKDDFSIAMQGMLHRRSLAAIVAKSRISFYFAQWLLQQ
jgi:hypothetical protein